MDANGIPYQDFNVAEDKTARDEMVKESGQMSVPTIKIDDEFVIGFDEAALKDKLGL